MRGQRILYILTAGMMMYQLAAIVAVPEAWAWRKYMLSCDYYTTAQQAMGAGTDPSPAFDDLKLSQDVWVHNVNGSMYYFLDPVTRVNYEAGFLQMGCNVGNPEWDLRPEFVRTQTRSKDQKDGGQTGQLPSQGYTTTGDGRLIRDEMWILRHRDGRSEPACPTLILHDIEILGFLDDPIKMEGEDDWVPGVLDYRFKQGILKYSSGKEVTFAPYGGQCKYLGCRRDGQEDSRDPDCSPF